MSSMKNIEQKGDMIFKINPVTKIRTSDNPIPGSENNIALYFETTKYYYYIHVNADVNPPKLDLERVTKEFDPHHDFIRHLQFKEKPVISHLGEDTDGDTLNSIPENEEDSNSSDASDPEEQLPQSQDKAILDRSQSEGSSSGSTSKPNSLDLRILSDPSIIRKMADASIDSANGEDGEKQTANAESPTNDKDVNHHGGVPETVGTNNTESDVCSNTDANIE